MTAENARDGKMMEAKKMRLIDADALTEDLKDYLYDDDEVQYSDKDRCYNNGIKCAIRRTKFHAPTIDAAPVVHAQWRYKVAYAAHVHVTNIIYCTACGKGFHRIEGVDFNFCPNCGARMDGE